MYFADHAPPHFHAEYGDHEALVNIGTLAVIAGRLPPRAIGLVMAWATLHGSELADLWEHARALRPLHRIDPLP